MLSETPVVEPQNQPDPRVEPPGDEGGTDVGLVVVVHEGERGGPIDTRVGERDLGELGDLHDPLGSGRLVARAGSSPAPAPFPLPEARLTAADTRSSRAVARARPTTGSRTPPCAGGTTRVTRSPYTPRNSAASRWARASSPATTMCSAASLDAL